MAQRFSSRRSAKRLVRKTRTNLIITLLLITLLLYATIQWILPTLITGIGFIRQNLIKEKVKPGSKPTSSVSENVSLAPPVLNIPYEATNTAQIDIPGFGTPGSKVKLFIDDEAKQTIEVSSDGSFTTQGVTLSLGTNNIYGKTVDEQGKLSLPSKQIKIIFDSEKPSLSINEPGDGKKIKGGEKKVKVSGKTDIGATVFVNGTQAIVDKDGNFQTELSINEGDNIISVKAKDPASNETEIQRKVTLEP